MERQRQTDRQTNRDRDKERQTDRDSEERKKDVAFQISNFTWILLKIQVAPKETQYCSEGKAWQNTD